MAAERITQLRVSNLRVLESVTLDLSGLMVLIGESGAGKSTIIEALEILRLLGTPETFLHKVRALHSPESLLRWGRTSMSLGVTLMSGGITLAYDIVLARSGETLVVEAETLEIGQSDGWPAMTIQRQDQKWTLSVDDGRPQVEVSAGNELILAQGLRSQVLHRLSSPAGARVVAEVTNQRRVPDELALADHIAGVRAALSGIEIHTPFEVTPLWIARSKQRTSAARQAVPTEPAVRLEHLGGNLACAIHALKNECPPEHWQQTLDLIRLGIGYHVVDAGTEMQVGGQMLFFLRFEVPNRKVYPWELSDGALDYLMFVALSRLGSSERSLLSFDEPEHHLHPALLGRVVELFENMSEAHAVLLTTHSDRLLDYLSDPASSVKVCELDKTKRTTEIKSLSAIELAEWLKTYNGVGELRSHGHLKSVLAE